MLRASRHGCPGFLFQPFVKRLQFIELHSVNRFDDVDQRDAGLVGHGQLVGDL
jgi:hypothetical protein